MIEAFLSMILLAAGQTTPKTPPSACTQALAAGLSGATANICLGEEQIRAADAAPKESAARTRSLEQAAAHFRSAANTGADDAVKTRALDALAGVFDAAHLSDPGKMEEVLRELIALQPNELAPVFRLARVQEDRGSFDAAEDTLLTARRQHPDVIDPYKMLAQFYARRATTLQQRADGPKQKETTPAPGERDENGIYRIGARVTAPRRLDRAVYPTEAVAAGIEGNVVAEVFVNETGDVIDAKIVRSIPLLDDAALDAVRNWHFAPTIVNGQPVRIRMNVTVNFTTR